MKKILVIILINVITSFSMNFNEYVNLKVGNIFVYRCTDRFMQPPYQCDGYYRMKIIITDTVSLSGKKYFQYIRQVIHISGTCSLRTFMFPFNVGNYNAIRLDSLNGMIYYYNPGNGCYYSPHETMIDSLNSKLNDTVRVRCVQIPYSYLCIDTIDRKKYYSESGNQGTIRREYLKGVGLDNNYQNQFISGSTWIDEQILIGRVINGVLYGDTSMLVGINKISSEILEKFSISQNYPNPFNPTTNLRFEISELRFVQLVVYDILGKEVQTLVNEQLKPGTYEVDFDGTNLPSGVYYYTLTAGDFSQTKKMVLIK